MPVLTGSTCFNINSVGNSKSAYFLSTVEHAEDPAAVSEELTASLGSRIYIAER